MKCVRGTRDFEASVFDLIVLDCSELDPCLRSCRRGMVDSNVSNRQVCPLPISSGLDCPAWPCPSGCLLRTLPVDYAFCRPGSLQHHYGQGFVSSDVAELCKLPSFHWPYQVFLWACPCLYCFMKKLVCLVVLPRNPQNAPVIIIVFEYLRT